jgi:hypothetical protein
MNNARAAKQWEFWKEVDENQKSLLRIVTEEKGKREDNLR